MGALKPWHIIVICVLLVLLFGAKRLPDAARSLGRSLRIIKAETAGLINDDNNMAEKAEPQQARQPLNGEVQQPYGQQPYAPQPGYQQPGYAPQPGGYQQQPGYAPQPGYQQQPGYAPQPGYQQPPAPQPYGQQQPPQAPAQPYVDPAQRTNDR
jgi:sec-independent protein translocase protein TatA